MLAIDARIRGGIAAGVLLFVADGWAYGQCSPSGLDDGPLEITKGAIDADVHYLDGTCASDVDAIPTARAQDVLDTFDTAYDIYGGFGFLTPYLNTLPEYNFYIYDIDTGLGSTKSGCIIINAPSFCADTSDEEIRKTTQHEIFHSIQRNYKCPVADCDSGGIGGTFGKWVAEGQARCTDDRTYVDLDVATFGGSFRDEIDSTFNRPEYSLFDHSYRAALFWSYACERFGALQSEPESGIDFLRDFWERIDANGSTDSADALDDILGSIGGTDLDETYLNYAVANYVHNLDLSLLPDPAPFIFIDEQQDIDNGDGPYDSVDVIAAAMPSNACGAAWPTGDSHPNSGKYAFWVYEANVQPFTCGGVGFRGESRDDCSADDDEGEIMGWAVVGVTGTGVVKGLSRGWGREYGRTYVVSPSDPIVKIAAIVVSLGEPSEFEYWFDTGELTVSIIRPTVTRLAYPGTAASPGRFLARVFVQGPASLEPAGVGPRSVKGLEPGDFEVKVGTATATVLTGGYVGGEYWLVVQAPVQAADGLYDLTVGLCPGGGAAVQDISANSVLYADITINHTVVVDRSGSMGDPVGNSKLDAAINAASLYIDAVSDNDRIGAIAFDGNGVDCDDDASVLQALATATGGQRGAAKTAVSGLTSGGWTSIGDGLWKAQDQHDLFPAASEIHTALLLSDGEENEARYWDTAAACNTAASRILGEDTVINAIAFGPQSNQPLMQDIAADTDGDYSYVDVAAGARGTNLSMTSDLADTYMVGLQQARRMQRLFFTSGDITGGLETFDISLAETAPETTFFFNVDDPAANLTVELRNPGGTLITPPTATIYSTSAHTVYHLNVALTPGDWNVRLNTTQDAGYIAGVLVRDPSGADLLLRFTQVHNGGLTGQENEGRFELGRPVTFLAFLTDSLGPIFGAQVEAQVTKPDGSTNCGTIVLHDDGAHQDGQPDDGLYGAVFTETWLGSAAGVDNDSVPAPPPGTNGSYRVRVTAVGQSNSNSQFNRVQNGSFQVFLTPRDRDQDTTPDTWEVQYGTDPFSDDALADPDGDGLNSRKEFELGTDPRDPDTDGGGETDGSEAAAGRCPLDASDDDVPPPLDVEVVITVGDEDEGDGVIVPGANLLRFPWHPTYTQMRVFRAVGAPVGLTLYKTLGPAEAGEGNYYDEDVVPWQTYYYQFQAVAGSGALSRLSSIVSATATQGLGDYDADGDVDLDDADDFYECMFGPNVPPTPSLPQTAAECIQAFDSDLDGDIDLDDFEAFQEAFD
ncbi:MAG: VWA domain-containing protein [bacterium]|nr:VWA domain-containing protein [bacterium]